MGFNGTFLFCEVPAPDTRSIVCEAVRAFYEAEGARYVSATELDDRERQNDAHLLGVGVSESVEGWVAVANSERSVERRLAELLASKTSAPVVVSSVAEICEPPEPESVQVFGADMEPRFEGLYHQLGMGYFDLAPLNPQFMLFRFEQPFIRPEVVLYDDDIQF